MHSEIQSPNPHHASSIASPGQHAHPFCTLFHVHPSCTLFHVHSFMFTLLCSLFYVPQALDILAAYASKQLGPGSFERVDTDTSSTQRLAAVTRFREGGRGTGGGSRPFIFLLHTKTLGLGTDLPDVDVAIIYDSNWHPRLDIQVRFICMRSSSSSPIAFFPPGTP